MEIFRIPQIPDTPFRKFLSEVEMGKQTPKAIPAPQIYYALQHGGRHLESYNAIFEMFSLVESALFLGGREMAPLRRRAYVVIGYGALWNSFVHTTHVNNLPAGVEILRGKGFERLMDRYDIPSCLL